MWPTQPSATVERMNPGFLAPCPPNPQLYPSHKTTLLSRRRGVLPRPAPATSISGSPFLFLPTVEFLIYDSSHEFSNKNSLFVGNLLQRRFLGFRKIDVCSFVSHAVSPTPLGPDCTHYFNGLRLAYPALKCCACATGAKRGNRSGPVDVC